MRKCVNCGANLDPQEKCDCASPKGEPPCSHGAVEQGGFATDKRNQNQKCDCASPKGEPPCSHGAVEQGGFATDKRNMNQAGEPTVLDRAAVRAQCSGRIYSDQRNMDQKCDCASPKGEKEKDRQDTAMSKAVTQNNIELSITEKTRYVKEVAKWN